jgi:hypothetical protein
MKILYNFLSANRPDGFFEQPCSVNKPFDWLKAAPQGFLKVRNHVMLNAVLQARSISNSARPFGRWRTRPQGIMKPTLRKPWAAPSGWLYGMKKT